MHGQRLCNRLRVPKSALLRQPGDGLFQSVELLQWTMHCGNLRLRPAEQRRRELCRLRLLRRRGNLHGRQVLLPDHGCLHLRLPVLQRELQESRQRRNLLLARWSILYRRERGHGPPTLLYQQLPNRYMHLASPGG